MGEFTHSISTTGNSQSPTSSPTNATPVQVINEALRLFEQQEPVNLDGQDVTALLTALRSYQQNVNALKSEYDRITEERRDAQRDAEALEANYRTLQARLTEIQQATPPAAPLTPTEAPRRSAEYPDPQEFGGNRDELEGFKFKLQQKLLMNADWFPTEQTKVGYAFSRLVGKAMYQILPRVSRPDSPAAITNVSQFLEALELGFGDPDRKNTAQKKIASLKQANRLFPEYLADFQRWIGDTGYDEQNQRYYFQNGLSRELQSYLVPIDVDNLSFDQLIAKCQLLDTRYRLVNPITTTARTTTTTTIAYAAGAPAVHTSSTDSNTAMDSSTVNARSRLGPRGPLTAEERQYRIEKSLCLYCGEPGHLARDCEKKKRAQAARDVMVLAWLSKL